MGTICQKVQEVVRFSRPRLEPRPCGWELLISPRLAVLWGRGSCGPSREACGFSGLQGALDPRDHVYSYYPGDELHSSSPFPPPHHAAFRAVSLTDPVSPPPGPPGSPRQNFSNFSAEVSLTRASAGPRAVEMKFLSSLSFYLKNSCEIACLTP